MRQKNVEEEVTLKMKPHLEVTNHQHTGAHSYTLLKMSVLHFSFSFSFFPISLSRDKQIFTPIRCLTFLFGCIVCGYHVYMLI